MAEASDTPVGRSRRLDLVLVGGLLLVALQTAVRALVVVPSYFSQDDFRHLYLADQLGLSRALLVRDHNGHLEMGADLVFALVGPHVGLSFGPAAATLLGMQLLASCLLLAVLRQLFGRSPWLLVPFAGYLFTPLGLPAATWWAAGLEALPTQIGMLTALFGLVAALRRRSPAWAALSVAGTALGLFFYEKAALTLPVLVAVLLLVEWAGEPLRRRLRLLAGAWPYLLPHVVLLAAYVPLYLSVVDSTASLDLTPGTSASAAGETVSRMLLPGVLGGPWTGAGTENTVLPDVGAGPAALCAAAVLAVLVASLWLRGPRALQGWLLAGGYVAVDVALVQLGRGSFLEHLTRDPRYVTDALPLIAIGTCAAFTGPLVRGHARWESRAAASRALALAACGLLVASCLLSTVRLAPELQHRAERDYVRGVLTALDGLPAGVSVVSSRLPYGVSLFPVPDLGQTLRTLGVEHPFDAPGTELRMFDGQGRLLPVILLEPEEQPAGPVPGCGWEASASAQRIGEVAGSPDPVVLGLAYLAAGEATVHVAVGGEEEEITLAPGLGRAYFVVTGQQGAVELRMSGAAPGTVCVDDVVVGIPWPEGVS